MPFAMGSTSGCNPSQDGLNLADYLCVACILVRFRSWGPRRKRVEYFCVARQREPSTEIRSVAPGEQVYRLLPLRLRFPHEWCFHALVDNQECCTSQWGTKLLFPDPEHIAQCRARHAAEFRKCVMEKQRDLFEAVHENTEEGTSF